MVHVSSVAGKNKLVVIALRGQHFGHFLIRQDPVVHVVSHDIRIEKVPTSHLHPDADWLDRAVRNEMLMKLPCAMRALRVIGPLLIYISSRVSENTMV